MIDYMSYLHVSQQFSSEALDVLDAFFHHACDDSTGILSFLSETKSERIRRLIISLTPGMDEEFLSKQRHQLEREAWWLETIQELSWPFVFMRVFGIPRGSELPKVYEYQSLSTERLDEAVRIIARHFSSTAHMSVDLGHTDLDRQVSQPVTISGWKWIGRRRFLRRRRHACFGSSHLEASM